MSSKLGLIISMIFFMMFYMLSVDVICIQYFYSDLDTKGVVISYDISKCLEIDEEYISSLEEKYKVKISDVSPEEPVFGDMVSYTLIRTYKPIIISRDEIVIKVKRSAVCGYY